MTGAPRSPRVRLRWERVTDGLHELWEVTDEAEFLAGIVRSVPTASQRLDHTPWPWKWSVDCGEVTRAGFSRSLNLAKQHAASAYRSTQ